MANYACFVYGIKNTKMLVNIHSSVRNLFMKNRSIHNSNSALFIPSRTFLDFTQLQNKKKEYRGRKLVGYSMEQLYSVVSDVENYNKFLPFCSKSLVSNKKTNRLKAELEVGFPPIKECYISNVTLIKPYLIQSVCKEGRLFNYLENLWRFSPGLKSNEYSCIVDFYVSFEFKSLLHSRLCHVFFDQLVEQMEKAFIIEASRRFGKATTKPVKLTVIDS